MVRRNSLIMDGAFDQILTVCSVAWVEVIVEMAASLPMADVMVYPSQVLPGGLPHLLG